MTLHEFNQQRRHGTRATVPPRPLESDRAQEFECVDGQVDSRRAMRSLRAARDDDTYNASRLGERFKLGC